MDEQRAFGTLKGLGIPGLNGVVVPGLAVGAWAETVRRARKRSQEIATYRLNPPERYRLYRYEYEHFYSGWVGAAFRFRACAAHNQEFTEAFRKSGGNAENEALYAEDEALFGFFVKGLSAFECLAYGLYALGALIRTPADSLPPVPGFPLLDPNTSRKLHNISLDTTAEAFTACFPDHSISKKLSAVSDDSYYKDWKQRRNMLIHRAASAGRSMQYELPIMMQDDQRPSTITQWIGKLPLTADLTANCYQWLTTTINECLMMTDELVRSEWVYAEEELSQLVR